MFVYILRRAFSFSCTCPAYNKSGNALARSLFMFSCSFNLITFCAPHLEVLELIALPKTAALIAKYHPLSKSFTSTLIWVTAAFFQAKQRVLERTLKKYIFAGAHRATILKIWWWAWVQMILLLVNLDCKILKSGV